MKDPANSVRRDLGLERRLHRAAARGDAAAAESLCAARADVDAATPSGRTALHLAASEGHMAVVECLLRRGADAARRDRWGSEPLKDAVWCGHAGVEALLLNAASAAGRNVNLAAIRELVQVGRPWYRCLSSGSGGPA
jgi:ankyrin repeat protein